ncbi:MAG: metal-sensitive transcriptional regulator [Beutenbergiaceae bacterium]
MQLDPEEMKAVVTRLRRAQGQLGGIIDMVESGRDCADIVTQIAAVSKAVSRAGFATISEGMRQCFADPEQTELDERKLEKLFLSLA